MLVHHDIVSSIFRLGSVGQGRAARLRPAGAHGCASLLHVREQQADGIRGSRRSCTDVIARIVAKSCQKGRSMCIAQLPKPIRCHSARTKHAGCRNPPPSPPPLPPQHPNVHSKHSAPRPRAKVLPCCRSPKSKRTQTPGRRCRPGSGRTVGRAGTTLSNDNLGDDGKPKQRARSVLMTTSRPSP